jgi:hypothetical protein
VDRLFLDANVLFTAAHRPQGKAAFLFQVLAIRGDDPPWHLLSSVYAIEEARRNLVAKFPATAGELNGLVARVQIVPQPASPRLPLDLPAKDIPIWAAALAAQATHLLTGDLRDFGPYMNRPEATGGVVIQTVADYLSARIQKP